MVAVGCSTVPNTCPFAIRESHHPHELPDAVAAQPIAGAGIAMAVLMVGAVGSHVKVGDPLRKSLPSFSLLLLSLFIAYANTA